MAEVTTVPVVTERPETSDGRHPKYGAYTGVEARMWAAYVATRAQLAPYLVPHRFEGKKKPEKLRRAGYGYGVPLNKMWVQEKAGDIRGAAARYTWGRLGDGEEPATGRPAGGIAQLLWDDATLDGVTWPNFFQRTTLERMIGGVGGFVLVDSPNIDASTQREERDAGKRPFLRFVPWKDVLDFGRGGNGFGYRWMEVRETTDTREPFGEESGEEAETSILYRLDGETGNAIAQRLNGKRQVVDTADLGDLQDAQGFPVLPLVPVKYGTHPTYPWLGTGITLGLDDVIVDLFNRLSETTEAFRDSAFGVFVHRGTNDEDVRRYFSEGARLIHLGNDEHAGLERIAGSSAEVEAGLRLIEMGVKAWSMGAGRKVAEAMERAEARSGVSLKAEFQLDARPLLVEIAEQLDQVETNVMWVAAQLAGLRPEQAAELRVERDTTFQLENEASRIARIVGEFADTLPLPPMLVEAAVVKWAESSDLVDDLTAEVEDGVTVLDELRREARELAENLRRQRQQRTSFLGGFDPEAELDGVA